LAGTAGLRHDAGAPETGRPGQILSSDADGFTVACSQAALRVLEVQRPGGKRMPAGRLQLAAG